MLVCTGCGGTDENRSATQNGGTEQPGLAMVNPWPTPVERVELGEGVRLEIIDRSHHTEPALSDPDRRVVVFEITLHRESDGPDAQPLLGGDDPALIRADLDDLGPAVKRALEHLRPLDRAFVIGPASAFFGSLSRPPLLAADERIRLEIRIIGVDAGPSAPEPAPVDF